MTFKTNQKIGGNHQVSITGTVEHFKIPIGNRFGTVVPRKHFFYKKNSENMFKYLKQYPNLNIWYTILVIFCSHFFLIFPWIFTIYIYSRSSPGNMFSHPYSYLFLTVDFFHSYCILYLVINLFMCLDYKILWRKRLLNCEIFLLQTNAVSSTIISTW